MFSIEQSNPRVAIDYSIESMLSKSSSDFSREDNLMTLYTSVSDFVQSMVTLQESSGEHVAKVRSNITDGQVIPRVYNENNNKYVYVEVWVWAWAEGLTDVLATHPPYTPDQTIIST